MNRKLVLLPGMTPSRRLFDRLVPHLENYVVIDWIAPGRTKTISEYARRLAADAGIDSTCDLVGVSFGGMVAQELAGILDARLCFIVSSISSSDELRPTQRIFSCLPQRADLLILKTIGGVANVWPKQASNAATVRARKFRGPYGEWFRWATSAALRWCPVPGRSTGFVRIHGDRDLTFPQAHQHADHVVTGAGHMLAHTHSTELATIIRQRQASDWNPSFPQPTK